MWNGTSYQGQQCNDLIILMARINLYFQQISLTDYICHNSLIICECLHTIITMINLQQFATINNQTTMHSNHKKELQIIVGENLQHLKVIFKITEYPYTSFNSTEYYEYFKSNTSLQSIIEDLHSWSEKELKLSSLFIVLPYQQRKYLSQIQSFTLLMCKFINKYVRFLTTLGLRNFSIEITSCLLQNNIKFIKSLDLLCCMVKLQSLVLFSMQKLNFLQELSLEKCNIGNRGIKTILKADWPNLKSLKIQDLTLTIGCVKYLKKSFFELNIIYLLCDDEQWANKLTTLRSQTIFLKRIFRQRGQDTQPVFLQSSRLLLFMNQIAKRQRIEEQFQTGSDLREVMVVFRCKVKLQ